MVKFKIGDEVLLIKMPRGFPTIIVPSVVSILEVKPENPAATFYYRILCPKTGAWYCDEGDIVSAKDLTNFEKIMYGIITP